MNTADNMGRAILRINMRAVFPGRPAHKPVKSVPIRTPYQHLSDGDRVSAVRALIVVDVQKDFCEGGALPISGGQAVARAINDYLAGEPGYHHVVATKDFHIDPGDHFSTDPDYASSWPPHCRAGSFGAEFDPNLDTSRINAVFHKGAYCAGYSGFEGVDENGTLLLDWLRQRGVDEVDVAGLATDHCVRRTARDAARAGLGTRVLVDLTAGVSKDSTALALDELSTASIALIGSGS
jgi:nicotinamidase/pyrazinamidase